MIRGWRNERAEENCSKVRLGVPSSRLWVERKIEWVLLGLGLGAMQVFVVEVFKWIVVWKEERSGWEQVSWMCGFSVGEGRCGLLSDDVHSSSMDEQAGRLV